MPYITQQDLESRYGIDEVQQLADRDGDTLHDESVVDTAINDADSIVNGFLATKVPTPVPVASDQLKRIVGDITMFYLHKGSAPKQVESNYSMAIKVLNDFSEGKCSIDGVVVDFTGDLAIVKTGHTRVFNDEALKGF